jgi:hypothetical protein
MWGNKENEKCVRERERAGCEGKEGNTTKVRDAPIQTLSQKPNLKPNP